MLGSGLIALEQYSHRQGLALVLVMTVVGTAHVKQLEFLSTASIECAVSAAAALFSGSGEGAGSGARRDAES